MQKGDLMIGEAKPESVATPEPTLDPVVKPDPARTWKCPNLGCKFQTKSRRWKIRHPKECKFREGYSAEDEQSNKASKPKKKPRKNGRKIVRETPGPLSAFDESGVVKIEMIVKVHDQTQFKGRRTKNPDTRRLMDPNWWNGCLATRLSQMFDPEPRVLKVFVSDEDQELMKILFDAPRDYSHA